MLLNSSAFALWCKKSVYSASLKCFDISPFIERIMTQFLQSSLFARSLTSSNTGIENMHSNTRTVNKQTYRSPFCGNGAASPSSGFPTFRRHHVYSDSSQPITRSYGVVFQTDGVLSHHDANSLILVHARLLVLILHLFIRLFNNNNNTLSETALNKLGHFRRKYCSRRLCRLFSLSFEFFATLKKAAELRGNATCCILSFGWFPGTWILCRCFGIPCCIFIGCLFHLHRTWTTYEDGIDRGFRNVDT